MSKRTPKNDSVRRRHQAERKHRQSSAPETASRPDPDAPMRLNRFLARAGIAAGVKRQPKAPALAAGDLCQCIAGDQHYLGRRPRGQIRGLARCLSQMIDLYIEIGFDFDLDVV